MVNILTVLQFITGAVSLVTFSYIFTLIFNKKIKDARKLLIPFGLIFGLFGAITGFTLGIYK